jgi:hypothetical protein
MSIWYVLWSFWYFFPVLVCCTQKNLATLTPGKKVEEFDDGWTSTFLLTAPPSTTSGCKILELVDPIVSDGSGTAP